MLEGLRGERGRESNRGCTRNAIDFVTDRVSVHFFFPLLSKICTRESLRNVLWRFLFFLGMILMYKCKFD